MKVWRYLQQLLQPSPAEPQVPHFILHQAENHVRIVNESAQIAAKSTVLETRISKLGVANDHMAQLKALSANYPRMQITRLAQFELDIKKIEAEVRELEMLHPLQRDDLHDGWVYRVPLL